MRVTTIMSVVLVLSVSAQAAIVSVAPSGDTMINSFFTSGNWGVRTVGFAGDLGGGGTEKTRGLLQFDLSAIPTNAIVDSATLRLAFREPTNPGSSVTLSLYKMTTAWVEGTSNSSAPSTTGATWDTKNGVTGWSTPGTGAGDRSTTASSSLTDTFAGSSTTRTDFSFTGAGLESDVQDWISNPSQSHGWVLINSDETNASSWKSWWSSEEAQPFDGTPYLDIEYTIIPEPASLALITSGTLLLSMRRR